MARRQALVLIEYETEANTPLTDEMIERAFKDQPYIHCPRAEVLEDDIA